MKNKEKKSYEEPMVEVIKLDSVDVITSSSRGEEAYVYEETIEATLPSIGYQ